MGAFLALSLAAFLEVWGDSFVQSAFYRQSGGARVFAIVFGIVVLTAYGSAVNAPRWEFGKLLGVYVVLFFVAAQIVAQVRFGQSPTAPVYAGGALIVTGGLVMMLWKA